MKYSSVQKGIRAERPIKIPILTETGLDDVECLVRPLLDDDEDTVVEHAIKYAMSRGVPDPKSGDPLYDRAYMRMTIALGVLDKDSPPKSREPFFDGGVDQIKAELSRETVVYVYALHEAWQDEVSPRTKKLSNDQVITSLQVLADGGSEAQRFLDELGPGLQRILLLTSANLLASARVLKSSSGSSSLEVGTTRSRSRRSAKKPPKRSARAPRAKK